MLIDIVAGARPNFMKIAPIIRALELRKNHGSYLQYRLVHTGQHYDDKMSESFFKQLGIPKPHINLSAGSGTQAEQTAAIMTRYENVLLERSSNLCLVVGDVNSTMACAIVAKKLNITVAHVEAGIRSGDRTMPEEINRLVTDSITDLYFTTSEAASHNLIASGVEESRIHFVGNTMIDTLLDNFDKLRCPDFFFSAGLQEGNYFVTTLHRPHNVDTSERILKVLSAISKGTRGMPVVFPIHPRTAKTLKDNSHLPANIYLVEPQPYLEFNWLVKHSKAVITDSGGVTEETTIMRVPCITLRDTTERPETVELGTNELIGTNPSAIIPSLNNLFDGKWKIGSTPPLWDGRSAQRIVDVLAKAFVDRRFQDKQ